MGVSFPKYPFICLRRVKVVTKMVILSIYAKKNIFFLNLCTKNYRSSRLKFLKAVLRKIPKIKQVQYVANDKYKESKQSVEFKN